VRSIDQGALDRWADLSRDHNPIHVDPAYASSTRFGGTILHGHLTMAWLMQRAQAEWGTAEWAAAGSLTGLRFRRPLRPDVGYRITAEGRAGDSLLIGVVTPDGETAVEALARLDLGGGDR
jgi:acyl dehydratase